MRILFLLLALLSSNDPRTIAKANALKKEAESAYLSGDYKLAIEKYRYLTDSMTIDSDLIQLNMGHAYYHQGDSANAKLSYGKAGMSADKKVQSIAYQQLGVMSKEANKLEPALAQLKSAIKADPTNSEAVYNYEVVKKLLEEQEQQKNQDQNQDNQDQNQDQNKDQEQKNKDQKQDQKEDQQSQEDQKQQNQQQEDQKEEDQDKQQKQGEGDQEEEQKEEPKPQEKSKEEMTKEKLQEMGITEEKARQLLEAMRQSEIKYLQNQKRKPTKRPPSGKPDW